MKKAELREEYLSKRSMLSEEDLDSISRTVSERLFEAVDFSKVGTVHLFLPIERLNEIDTWQIAYRIWTQYPSVRTVVPKVDRESGELKSIVLTRTTPIEPSEWDVPEPTAGVEVAPSEIDVVLVPLLCSDERGHRVGYGKGFYDRFLAKCRLDSRKIGLSHFQPVEMIDDVTAMDVRLDEVVDGRQ